MGYYTNYYLEIENKDDPNPELEMQIANELARISGEWDESDLEYAAGSIHPLGALVGYDSMKWYDHQEDMEFLSCKFPHCKFILEGQGEDPEDLWREYYYNGHMQYAPARIVYDEPRWEDLKNE